MNDYESFKNQLLKHGLGQLRTREKKEFLAKVAEYAYEDEKKKISSLTMEPVAQALVKTAMLRRARELMSTDVNNPTPKTEESTDE